jgi:hypothetical protein
MAGFIVFTLILLVYGIVLSHNILSAFLPNKVLWGKIGEYTEKNRKRVVLSVLAIIVGLWNLFAPDFGAMNSPTIIGAIVPSAIMIFNGFVLCPEIIGVVNLSKKSKKKFIKRMSQFKKFAGPVTIVAGILHIIFFRAILF